MLQMGPTMPLQRRTRVRSPRMTDSVRCEACGSGDAVENLPLCGGCKYVLHIFYLRPILPRIPADSWFCPSCSSSSARYSSKNKRPKDIRLIESFLGCKQGAVWHARGDRPCPRAQSLLDPCHQCGARMVKSLLLSVEIARFGCKAAVWHARGNRPCPRAQRKFIKNNACHHMASVSIICFLIL